MNILTSFPDKNIQEKTESLSNLKDINPSSIIDDEYSDLNMEHKDILVGGNSWQYHSYRYKQMGMTAEVEIRRLTAQLTAAYNRIAALEEQLLSKKNAESKVTK
jgi:predicted  nucleic acid-binding Zn-ribbon protein